ncbi:hypothetical protein LPJ72_001206 [Coemansia sp. Benny D160-2]|nr:hypothetical protein LPJ72_001206 [Coemansia sp. Benny D160-2]
MTLQVQPVARRITAVAWLPPHAGAAYNDARLSFVTGSGGKHRELALWTTGNPDFADSTTDEDQTAAAATLAARVAHDGDVRGIAAVSSQTIVTASSFGTVSVYQTDDGAAAAERARLELRESMTAHRFGDSAPAAATDVAVQPGAAASDAEVASCGEDGAIAYARAARLDALQRFEVDSTAVTGVCWPTSTQTAACTRAGQVKVFDRRAPADVAAVLIASQTAAAAPSSSSALAFECIAAHPSQSFRLATGTNAGSVLLWDTRNMRAPVIEAFNVHRASVWDVCFDPVGSSSSFVSCSDDASLAVTQWSADPASSSSSPAAADMDGSPSSSPARPVRHISSFFNVLSVNCLDVCAFTRASVIVAGSDSGNLLIDKVPASDHHFRLF